MELEKERKGNQRTYHNRLQINRRPATPSEQGIVIINCRSKKWKEPSLETLVVSECWAGETTRRTYTIRLACHMQSTAFKLREGLEENGNESSNVSCRVFCGSLEQGLSWKYTTSQLVGAPYNHISIREPGAHRVINEEYIRVGIPRLWMVLWSIRVEHAAGTCIHISPRYTGLTATNSPSSMNNPVDEEHPGPPLVQKTTSSLSGSDLLSKK